MILCWFRGAHYWLLRSQDNTIIAGQISEKFYSQTEGVVFTGFRTLKPEQTGSICLLEGQYVSWSVFKTFEESTKFVEQAASHFYIILNDKQKNLL